MRNLILLIMIAILGVACEKEDLMDDVFIAPPSAVVEEPVAPAVVTPAAPATFEYSGNFYNDSKGVYFYDRGFPNPVPANFDITKYVIGDDGIRFYTIKYGVYNDYRICDEEVVALFRPISEIDIAARSFSVPAVEGNGAFRVYALEDDNGFVRNIGFVNSGNPSNCTDAVTGQSVECEIPSPRYPETLVNAEKHDTDPRFGDQTVVSVCAPLYDESKWIKKSRGAYVTPDGEHVLTFNWTNNAWNVSLFVKHDLQGGYGFNFAPGSTYGIVHINQTFDTTIVEIFEWAEGIID